MNHVDWGQLANFLVSLSTLGVIAGALIRFLLHFRSSKTKQVQDQLDLERTERMRIASELAALLAANEKRKDEKLVELEREVKDLGKALAESGRSRDDD